MSGIVFFSPHPDDVEFVLGGTVLLHCNRYATKIVVMTDGALQQMEQRKLGDVKLIRLLPYTQTFVIRT